MYQQCKYVKTSSKGPSIAEVIVLSRKFIVVIKNGKFNSAPIFSMRGSSSSSQTASNMECEVPLSHKLRVY